MLELSCLVTSNKDFLLLILHLLLQICLVKWIYYFNLGAHKPITKSLLHLKKLKVVICCTIQYVWVMNDALLFIKRQKSTNVCLNQHIATCLRRYMRGTYDSKIYSYFGYKTRCIWDNNELLVYLQICLDVSLYNLLTAAFSVFTRQQNKSGIFIRL